jgi:hypothetical protein
MSVGDHATMYRCPTKVARVRITYEKQKHISQQKKRIQINYVIPTKKRRYNISQLRLVLFITQMGELEGD